MGYGDFEPASTVNKINISVTLTGRRGFHGKVKPPYTLLLMIYHETLVSELALIRFNSIGVQVKHANL